MKQFKLLVIVIAILFSNSFNGLIAQITVNNLTTLNNVDAANALVDSLMGGGVTYSNVSFQGVRLASQGYQMGYFTTATTTLADMGIAKGVALTSGNTDIITLPLGTDPGAANTFSKGYVSSVTGEIRKSTTNINDMDVLAGAVNWYNGCILEFDFVPNSDSIEFNYVFGGEEYADNTHFISYQCTEYNDKFGFLISGPGISGGAGYDNDARNIARLSNGSEVGINSVNDGVPAGLQSYCTNANPDWNNGVPVPEFFGTIDGTKPNGNTIILKAAQGGLTPGATYHIKLLILDASDGAYDAIVYIEAGSFVAVNPSCTAPVITNPGNTSACGSYSLPAQSSIGGTNLVNPLYYDNSQASGGNEITNLTLTSTQTVYIYDEDGTCNDEESFVVTINPDPTPTISGNLSFCTGGNTTLDAGAGYSNYSWSGGGSNQTLNVTSGGSYTVTVTDGNGCTGTDNVTVTENANLTPNITGTLEFCAGTNTILDAGAGYTSYNWTGGATSQTNTITSAGSYTVTVSDATGCTGTDNVNVTENANPTPTITGNTPFCSGNSITLDAGSYSSYSWSPSGSTQTINVISGGIYAVTVTDVNGCTGTDNVTATENTNPTPSITGNSTFCSGNSITLDAGSYSSYIWSPSGSSQTLNVTTGGSYAVTVTDGNGCTGSDNVTVTENNNPTPAIIGALSFCTGGNTTLDAGSGYTSYNWSPSGSSQTLNVTTGGNYVVTVTDANGCTGTDNVTVIENSSLTPNITGALEFCTGSNTVLDAGSGYNSYSWSPSGSNQTITVTTGGNYTVTVSDVNGCTGTDMVTVTENSNPTPTITGNTPFCSGSSITLDAGSYSSYIWSPSGSSQTVNVTSGGTYTVTVTDANGCTGTDNITAIENPNPTPTITGTLSFCTGFSTTLDAGSGYSTYNWSPSGNSQTLSVTAGGNYTVTVSDINGCTGTDMVTVIENSSLIPVISGTLSFCADGSTTLDAGNGYDTYTWSTSGSTQTIVVTTGGNYAVTVSDASGCTGTDNVTVVENPNPTPLITGALSFCSGSNTVLDAGASYTNYSWTGGGTNQTYIVTNGGSFTVTVTDANGCTGTDIVTVTENQTSLSINNISICDGDSVLINNIWQTTAGTFYDSLLTTSGCDSVIVTNLSIDNATDASITPVSSLCGNSISITLTAANNGGVWSGNGIVSSSSGIFNPDIAGPGAHQIIYTINGSCGSADTTYIVVDTVPTAAITGENEVMLGGNLTLTATGGVTYQWTPADELSCANCQYIEVSPSDLTNYCVVVTDINGCKDSACFVVYVNKDCGELFVPNAFSPNGDGFNDVLYVEGECISIFQLSIYDRWGELVFESNDQHIGWDGTYKGKRMDDAVFMYYLKVTFTNLKTQELKGNISLIR